MTLHNPKVKEGLSWQKVDQITVVIDLGEDRMFHELNETSSDLWGKLNGKHSVSELITHLETIYEVDPETAKQSVLEFITDLESKNLLE